MLYLFFESIARDIFKIIIFFISTIFYALRMILGCHYSCRYNLTCMSYAHYAFKKFSFFKAIVKTVRRVLSCHPFSRKTDEDLE